MQFDLTSLAVVNAEIAPASTKSRSRIVPVTGSLDLPAITSGKFTPKSEGGGAKFSSDDEGSSTLYCLCRKPDTGTPMIACDGCEEWFHYACVGLEGNSKKVARLLNSTFLCPTCKTTQTTAPTSLNRKRCSLEDCYKFARKAGMCAKHYRQHHLKVSDSPISQKRRKVEEALRADISTTMAMESNGTTDTSCPTRSHVTCVKSEEVTAECVQPATYQQKLAVGPASGSATQIAKPRNLFWESISESENFATGNACAKSDDSVSAPTVSEPKQSNYFWDTLKARSHPPVKLHSPGDDRQKSNRHRRCGVEGCTNYARSGGVCVMHGAVAVRKLCRIPNCVKFARKLGLCVGHARERTKLSVEQGSHNRHESRRCSSICDLHDVQSQTSPYESRLHPSRNQSVVRTGNGRKKCTVAGCSKYARVGGTCVSHSSHATREICAADGCCNYARQRGLCGSHAKYSKNGRSGADRRKESESICESEMEGRSSRNDYQSDSRTDTGGAEDDNTGSSTDTCSENDPGDESDVGESGKIDVNSIHVQTDNEIERELGRFSGVQKQGDWSRHTSC